MYPKVIGFFSFISANSLSLFFLSFSCFLVLIDTGGWSGLRLLGFIGLLLYLKINYRILRKKSIAFFLSLLLILSTMPALFYPYANNQDFSLGFSQTIPIFVYPLLLLVLSVPDKYYDSLISLLTIMFSATILVFFVARVYDFFGANAFASHLDSTRLAGFFDHKSNLLGYYLPVVYFKATLLLVPLGVYCFGKKLYLPAIMSSLALFFAPSRTGFVLVMIFYLFIVYSYMRPAIKIIIASMLVLLIYSVVVWLQQFVAIDSLIMGFEVRLGHLISLLRLDNNYESLLLGQGPGTFFYSSGFGHMTDGVELSQLEYTRRYGILSLFVLFVVWFVTFVQNPDWKLPVLSYWIAAMSNPILAVFFSFFFLALMNSKFNVSKRFSKVCNEE